jgi:hypothetical protein
VIWAAALTIASVAGVAYLVGHCVWYCRRPPRNRYVPDRLTRGRVLRADGLRVERIR